MNTYVSTYTYVRTYIQACISTFYTFLQIAVLCKCKRCLRLYVEPLSTDSVQLCSSWLFLVSFPLFLILSIQPLFQVASVIKVGVLFTNVSGGLVLSLPPRSFSLCILYCRARQEKEPLESKVPKSRVCRASKGWFLKIGLGVFRIRIMTPGPCYSTQHSK